MQSDAVDGDLLCESAAEGHGKTYNEKGRQMPPIPVSEIIDQLDWRRKNAGISNCSSRLWSGNRSSALLRACSVGAWIGGKVWAVARGAPGVVTRGSTKGSLRRSAAVFLRPKMLQPAFFSSTPRWL